MATTKAPEPLENPLSSQNNIDNQATHSQSQISSANHNLTTGSYNDIRQPLSTNIPCNQPTPVLDGAPFEPRDFTSFRTADHVCGQDRIEDEFSSRAKMWDPVKDCSDPNTVQANVTSFLSARHSSSEHSIDSTAGEFASMGLRISTSHPLDQDQDSQEHMNSVTRGITSKSLRPHQNSHDTAPGCPGNNPTDLLPYPLSDATASGYRGSSTMGSPSFQAGHSFNQSQRSYQQRTGYENISTLPPHPRDSSAQQAQQSFESIIRRPALMAIQPCQVGNSSGNFQEDGQHFTSTDSRLLASLISHGPLTQHLPPSMTSTLSTQGRPESQQANRTQHQTTFAHMTQALRMANYAQSLDQQSNGTEAVPAYEQACELFQEALIWSPSVDERMQCNEAKNACQARLNVLLRESAARLSNESLGQDDQQEEDGPGGGKPQYSLLEDWTLCRKVDEDLSWQEVAETPVFKGRRKHRSLSQRKHTISRMGPKFYEAESPWTEDEDRKLCALGDAGKTLGDIRRKFRNRNAERCMNRYFSLKGYPTSGKNPSQQAHHTPGPSSLSTQQMLHPSVVARYPAYRDQPITSVIEPVSYRKCTGTPPQPSYQAPTTSNHNKPSIFTLDSQTPEAPSSALSVTGAEASINSAASMSSNNAISTETFVQNQDLSDRSRPAGPANSSAASSFSSPGPDTGGPHHSTNCTFAQTAMPNTIGATNGETSDNLTFSSTQQKPTVLSSSSASPADSHSRSSSTTTSPSPCASVSSPLEKPDPQTSHRAAANRVRKSRRTAHSKKV